MTKAEKALVEIVWKYYKIHGRQELPWRKTKDPYKIAVSELMLQQTQVSRVIPKYHVFLKQFPTNQALADASLKDVLMAWQGLGYNRRAKYLWLAAKMVKTDFNGTWPKAYLQLQSLPGIGTYTAGAIMAFAYNRGTVILETNIRTVFLHHLYAYTFAVSDAELKKHVASTLDTNRPGEWYAALMDYGSHLKTTVGNASKRSAGYKKQTTFKMSTRFVRGTIIKQASQKPVTFSTLKKALVNFSNEEVLEQIEALIGEELLVKRGYFFVLP